MDVLAEAIARQDADGADPIDATEALLEQRSRALAFNRCKPIATAVLAYCDAHPVEVGPNAELVADLRHALATGEPPGFILLAIYCEVDGACDVTAAKAEG